jgi:hypothetical protein
MMLSRSCSSATAGTAIVPAEREGANHDHSPDFILVASALTLAGAAHASELKPIQPQSIQLGEVSGVAYYTVERDGFHVAATLGEGEAGTSVRFQTMLLPGQSADFSTPRAVGGAPVLVEISRQGDQVFVTEALTN